MIYLLLTALFIAFSLYRERQHDARTRELLNRIQAPERVVELIQPETKVVPHVGFDDDTSWWNEQERLGVTRGE